jgi:hypothetical protein
MLKKNFHPYIMNLTLRDENKHGDPIPMKTCRASAICNLWDCKWQKTATCDHVAERAIHVFSTKVDWPSRCMQSSRIVKKSDDDKPQESSSERTWRHIRDANWFMVIYLTLTHLLTLFSVVYVFQFTWKSWIAFFVLYYLSGVGITGMAWSPSVNCSNF